MRLRAPTDGFIWFDSISEIVEFVTPARLARVRWDSPCRVRTWRRRSPTSALMALVSVEGVEDRATLGCLAQDSQALAAAQKRTCCGARNRRLWGRCPGARRCPIPP